jgi:hypothetical protein
MIGAYRFLPVATARCVHFVDISPDEGGLVELADHLREQGITVVYLDCARFAAPMAAARGAPDAGRAPQATPTAPRRDPAEPHWTRWWDDLLSLSHKSSGLAIVLDNAGLLFERDRKFVTDVIENFLQGATPWIRREIPCHLVLQMVGGPAVARVLHVIDADTEGDA